MSDLRVDVRGYSTREFENLARVVGGIGVTAAEAAEAFRRLGETMATTVGPGRLTVGDTIRAADVEETISYDAILDGSVGLETMSRWIRVKTRTDAPGWQILQDAPEADGPWTSRRVRPPAATPGAERGPWQRITEQLAWVLDHGWNGIPAAREVPRDGVVATETVFQRSPHRYLGAEFTLGSPANQLRIVTNVNVPENAVVLLPSGDQLLTNPAMLARIQTLGSLPSDARVVPMGELQLGPVTEVSRTNVARSDVTAQVNAQVEVELLSDAAQEEVERRIIDAAQVERRIIEGTGVDAPRGLIVAGAASELVDERHRTGYAPADRGQTWSSGPALPWCVVPGCGGAQQEGSRFCRAHVVAGFHRPEQVREQDAICVCGHTAGHHRIGDGRSSVELRHRAACLQVVSGTPCPCRRMSVAHVLGHPMFGIPEFMRVNPNTEATSPLAVNDEPVEPDSTQTPRARRLRLVREERR